MRVFHLLTAGEGIFTGDSLRPGAEEGLLRGNGIQNEDRRMQI